MKQVHALLVAAIALIAAFALPGPALAQNTDGPVGSTYVQEVHGDWQVRCLRRDIGGDPCQMYQQMNDAEGRPTAEINLFDLPPGQAAAAGAVIVTPLETLLTEELSLRVDAGASTRYPFAWCNTTGCLVRIGLTAEEVGTMRQGAAATVTIVPVASPNQPIELRVSLAGFTAGFAAMAALNQTVQR